MDDTRTLEEQLAHCDGRDCECLARSSGECGCDADWTPAEVYRLRAEKFELEQRLQVQIDLNTRLREQNSVLQGRLDPARRTLVLLGLKGIL